MTRTSGCRLLAGAALVVLLVLVVSPAAADFKQDYLKARNALDDGDWAGAETLLRRALAEESRESARVRMYSTIFQPYLPHFYLGETLVKLGRCDEALRALDESERQGVVQAQVGEYDRLKRYREQCRGAVQPPTAAPTVSLERPPTPTPARGVEPRLLREAQQRSQEAIDAAAKSEEAAKSLRRRADCSAVWDQRADLVHRLDQASAKLERARSQQRAALSQELVADLDGVTRMAGEARQELEAVQEAVTTARDRLAREDERTRDARRQQLLAEIQTLVGPAERLHRDGQRLPAETRRALGTQLEAVKVALDQARDTSGLSVPRLESVREQLTLATRDLDLVLQQARGQPLRPTPSPGPPELPTSPVGPPSGQPATPPALRSAVAAYLRADLRGTVEALERVDFAEPRTAAVGLLFRAAARFLLFVEGGRRATDLEEAARADVRAMRAKDPSVVPDREVFSPLFVDFCATVR